MHAASFRWQASEQTLHALLACFQDLHDGDRLYVGGSVMDVGNAWRPLGVCASAHDLGARLDTLPGTSRSGPQRRS